MRRPGESIKYILNRRLLESGWHAAPGREQSVAGGRSAKPPARSALVQVPIDAETRPVPGTLLCEAFHGSPLPRGERPSCHGRNRRPFRTGPEHIHVSSAGSPFSTCASTRHSSHLSSYVRVFPRHIPLPPAALCARVTLAPSPLHVPGEVQPACCLEYFNSKQQYPCNGEVRMHVGFK